MKNTTYQTPKSIQTLQIDLYLDLQDVYTLQDASVKRKTLRNKAKRKATRQN